MVAASFFLSRGGLSIFNEKNGSSVSKNSFSDKAPNFDNWKTYRNEAYGFEIKYPGRFEYEEYFETQRNTVDANCGRMVDKTLEVYLDKEHRVPSYSFSIYSNNLKLTPKDFFICQRKAEQEGYDLNKIESVEVIRVGNQGSSAAIINEGRITTAVIFENENIYEIRQETESVDDTAMVELNQILTTAKFFKVKADPQTEKNISFCAGRNEDEFGKGILAFFEPIISDGTTVKEAFIGCQVPINRNQGEWLADYPVDLYHIIDDGKGGYDIAWHDNTGKEGLNWIYVTAPTTAGDLDGDGAQEVFFSAKGTCVQNCSQWCLYIAKDKKLFCATSITRTEAPGNDISMEGKECVTDSNATNCQGECTVLKRTLCFDKGEPEQKYGIFKEYLQNNILPGI